MLTQHFPHDSDTLQARPSKSSSLIYPQVTDSRPFVPRPKTTKGEIWGIHYNWQYNTGCHSARGKGVRKAFWRLAKVIAKQHTPAWPLGAHADLRSRAAYLQAPFTLPPLTRSASRKATDPDVNWQVLAPRNCPAGAQLGAENRRTTRWKRPKVQLPQQPVSNSGQPDSSEKLLMQSRKATALPPQRYSEVWHGGSTRPYKRYDIHTMYVVCYREQRDRSLTQAASNLGMDTTNKKKPGKDTWFSVRGTRVSVQ